MDLRPSWDLSFVIGSFLGDGTFVEDSDYHHFVRLSVRDRDFAEAFNQSVARVLNRPLNKITASHNRGKLFYDAKYSSRQLGMFLKQPIENHRPIIEAYPAPFLRGLFSADGCASIRASRTGLKIATILANSDLELLQLAKSVLWSHFRIHSRVYLGRTKGTTWKFDERTVVLRRDSYQLRIQRIRDVRTFALRIGFEIRRKQKAIQKAMQLIDELGMAKAGRLWEKWAKRRRKLQPVGPD